MLRKYLSATFALLAFAGLTACAGEDEIESDAVVTDTVVTPEVVEVPVTVPDTAVVTRDVDVDVDTVDIDTDTDTVAR